MTICPSVSVSTGACSGVTFPAARRIETIRLIAIRTIPVIVVIRFRVGTERS